MSGAAVERYVVGAGLAKILPDLAVGEELVRASAHDAAIAALTAELQQCREALRVCRATLPHMGGNQMATYSLCADIDAALKERT